MIVQQQKWLPETGWQIVKNSNEKPTKGLVFAFGNRYRLEEAKHYDEISALYPNSHIITASTSGEIVGEHVYDDSIIVTAIEFEKTEYKLTEANSKDFESSYDIGKTLADSFDKDGLRHVFIISEGNTVNGTELVKGLNKNLPDIVTVTGGLAGDGPRFEKTLVGLNQAPETGNVIAIGFYGDSLQVGYGSLGGWDAFGPRRLITKSESNILYELDGKSALELYKKYLGSKAEELPGSALLFPLSIKVSDEDRPLVRTILNIDEETGAMIFAGDMPEGATAQLMKANFDKLVDGAYEAASSCKDLLGGNEPEVAMLISCVGRKLVLDQRVEEELESVAEVVGEEVPKFGFYSYGEIAPFAGLLNCELHNQTMTITLMREN